MLVPCSVSGCSEMLIANHLLMMSLPAFVTHCLHCNLNQVHSMSFCLHGIKFQESNLSREVSVIQSISACCGTKGDLLELEVLIVVLQQLQAGSFFKSIIAESTKMLKICKKNYDECSNEICPFRTKL